jgi:hypothetical protein
MVWISDSELMRRAIKDALQKQVLTFCNKMIDEHDLVDYTWVSEWDYYPGLKALKNFNTRQVIQTLLESWQSGEHPSTIQVVFDGEARFEYEFAPNWAAIGAQSDAVDAGQLAARQTPSHEKHPGPRKGRDMFAGLE